MKTFLSIPCILAIVICTSAWGQQRMLYTSSMPNSEHTYVMQQIPPAYQLFTLVGGVATAVTSNLSTGQIPTPPAILAKCSNAGAIVDCNFTGGGGGGVTEIIPGTNTTCTPFISGNCVGNVTINTTGGGSTITCVTAGGIAYWNGSAFVCTAAGTSGQVLTWPVSGSIPAFQTLTAGSLTDNILLNSPTTGKLFAETDSIGLIANGGFPEKLATILTIPSGNQSINAIGSASLPDMLTCATAGAGSCTQDGTWPLSFPLGVTSNSKVLLEAAYNDLSNMGSAPTGNQMSYYFGGLKAWLLEFGIPDSQKLAANGAYCTTTGTWTSVSAVPGGHGTFPAGSIQTTTPGATLVCTTHNATDAGIISYKSTASTVATFTVMVVNAGVTYDVADPYTGSTTLNQTGYYTTAWGGTANLYAVGQSGMPGGYTTITLTAANNSVVPIIVVAPYFISASSSLQNFPAVEIMLESRAGCNGACSSVGGPQHNDVNTNTMRTAQVRVVNELRSNGLNVSYFDPNATPTGFNSSDPTQTSDGTHPNGTSAQFIANAAFVNFNSAANTPDHFLASSLLTTDCALLSPNSFVSAVNVSTGQVTCTQIPVTSACGAGFAHFAAITMATASGGSDLNNFPLLMGFNGAVTNSITLTNLKTVANGGQVQSASAFDVIFCSAASGGTQLAHEMVPGSYDPTTGAGEWYVRIPTISHSTGTVIYAFWDNASATNTANVPATWSNGYQAVYHAGIASSLSLLDSTVNGNNLTNNGATATAGQFGGAFSVTPSTYVIDVSPIGMPTATAARTVEAWVQFPTTPPIAQLVAFGYGDNFNPFALLVNPPTNQAGFFDAIGALYFNLTPNTAWHSYVGVLPTGQSTLAGTLTYIDGVLGSSPACSGTCNRTLATNSTNLQINGIPGPPLVAPTTEIVDELRISSIDRTAGWIATQYANQSNNASFITSLVVF